MTGRRDLESVARQRIAESIVVKDALLRDRKLLCLVVEVARDLAQVLRKGHRIFLFGNGGSAADAQHIAAELVGRYKLERRGLPVQALTVNASSLTAIANDYSFDSVFARQLEALGSRGDAVVGISTSGNSPNVLKGIKAAKSSGMMSVGLTGRQGGRLKKLADRCICVPSEETPRIQEAHILIGHLLSEMIEQEVFSG